MEQATKDNVAKATSEGIKLLTKIAVWAAALGTTCYAVSELANQSAELSKQAKKVKTSIKRCYDDSARAQKGKAKKDN